MNKIIFNMPLVLLMLFAVSKLHAAEMVDVIYLENGSIVRGIIVEQNLRGGVYKIQSEGGNVFVYKKDDIEKITKELKVVGGQGGVNININNTSPNSAPVSTRPVIAPVSDDSPSRSHAIGVSSWVLTLADTDTEFEDNTDVFQGAALTYQYGLNDHIAVRVNFYAAEHEDSPDWIIEGLQGQILLTTNARDNGFKFYVGAGYFSEKWKNDKIDVETSYSGGEGLFGFGYNWSRVGLDLTATIRPNSVYDAEEVDVLFITSAFRLTFRF